MLWVPLCVRKCMHHDSLRCRHCISQLDGCHLYAPNMNNSIWYVGNGVNEAPVVLDNAAGVPLDASQYYKLTFIEKGKVRYAKMSVGADELNAGRLAFDFGSSTPIDDDRCSVKLERVKLMYDPDVTDSPRFRVFRIGAQPRVPARYRYVADILKPAYNQEYSADEPLPLEIQIAMDIPEGQKLEVVLKDAVTGEEIEREIDEDGDGEADDEEPVAKSFAGSDVDEALRVLTSTMNIRGAVTAGRRYFVEVNAMTGMFQKRQTMLYRVGRVGVHYRVLY